MPHDPPRHGAESEPSRLVLVLSFSRRLSQIRVPRRVGYRSPHQHAGLSIPDFPLAYGKLWPATDADSIARYNQQRMEVAAANPITAFQVELQMIHRLLAGLILAGVAASVWQCRKARSNPSSEIRLRMAYGWLALIAAQIILGASTIWTNKAADVATAHVLIGALSLATGSLLCVLAFRPNEQLSEAPVDATVSALNPGLHPATAGRLT